ncbi:MAG: uncharacterized membrane protein YjgN (DUF898 family) [Pseudohongiellaceae bacterium]|jgi:uncharacterized membrane protein YjgN (DUF898 family)
MAPLNISLEADSVLGLVAAVLSIRICSGFIYYWLHRVQHENSSGGACTRLITTSP